ncbi:MAG: hypothetical protein IKU30_04860 [Clostridia bacterium]|nr:hypothetical protein [Clostridia bacterium]
MKPERIIKLITDATNNLSKDEKNTLEKIRLNPSPELLTVYDLIEKLRAEAEAELRTEKAKSAGAAEKLKTANKIINEFAQTREQKKAYKLDDKIIIPSVFNAVRLYEGIAGMEIDETPKLNAPFFNAPNYTEIFRKNIDAAQNEYKLPSISELRGYIKLCKAEKKKDKYGAYYMEYGGIAFDAQRLLDVLILLTDEKRGIYPTAKNGTYQIYIVSDLGDAIVCLMRKKTAAA